MGFRDILKKSFLESYNLTDITTTDIVVAVFMACVLGLYIFVVYRIVTRKAFYSKSFSISLVALAMITTAVILTIQSSVVVSLGMVGALSIVRFRTAIKDPMDLIFLFWSISVGIICGVGLFELAVLISVSVSLVIVMLELLPVVRLPMLLIINTSDKAGEKAILENVRKYTKNYKVKSRNITDRGLDMIVELRVKKDCESLIQEVQALNGVISASLLLHEGEATY
ncbi:DUF4956 domain-containing protein [Acetatifactor muris]|jgi:uncharacterized membrane protein YhiD involved in acid resistance|uniref:Mg(2+) transport ATPase n=1 Tax=Acetatifactor muris TaxID=879566 RepID=A0A2K4ZMI9_9FIRM|nr:DUF4956 domain-containing protein [Acetatifactor muris]MCR2049869.1 DUF4956 domain-containing protein [Acetatifactor muris]SOY31636.1 hypothetical protein AMURIS_04380 [Acetatifactor muris]